MDGGIFGADFLTNPKLAEGNMQLPELSTVELPSFDAPKLMPSLSDVGPMRTTEGLENLNAESFFGPSKTSTHRMSEEHTMKEKYEILRKFERLSKLGVPLRKRFTLDSPLEEMKSELEFIRREKAMDRTIKQFCDWYITGMSALEWSSTNVEVMKAMGLNLNGLSESAQMNVGDMEEDFEELYELYGDKLTMHPLVRIPVRICTMVYMVNLTNNMVKNAPVPNMDQILKTHPDIARQLATAAMQQQTQSMKAAPRADPLAGMANFMSSMIPPPPPAPVQTTIRPAVRIAQPPQPPKAPVRVMAPPSVNIDELIKTETKRVVSSPPPKKGGSTGKNSVTIKL